MKITRIAAAIIAALALPLAASVAQAWPGIGGLPAGTHFTSLDYHIGGGWGLIVTDLKLAADGTLSFDPGHGKPVVNGKATPAEMRAVIRAWNQARLGPGSSTIPGMVPDAPTFNLNYSYCGNAFHMCANGSVNGFQMLVAKNNPGLSKLLTALNAIERRLQTPPAPPAPRPMPALFDAVSIKIQNPMALYQSTLSVASDGSISYQPPHNRPAVTDKATPAELQAVKDAIAKADVKSLPSNVSPGFVPDGSTFDVSEKYSDGSSKDVNGFYAKLGSYAARVQPLLDALQAIQTRLDSAKTPGAAGVVSHP